MAVFHLKVSVGSREGGQSARAKADYIEREGRYEPDREELEHRESGNMPEWAKDDPRSYWEAADEYERANGSLYREIQFALPRELNEQERRELASGFARRLTEGERLPYTLAIHRGGPDGGNPHAHLMVSERGLDGHERSREQWFRRYNAKAPEKGGAKKSRTMMSREWVKDTREAWAREANEALERAGREERVDHRSLASLRDEAERSGDLERAAELSREPNVHLGPEAYRADRGGASETVQKAVRVGAMNAAEQGERDASAGQVERLEREIAALETRMKETYDRVRAAIDERIRQAGRAIRRGSKAVSRAGRSLGEAGSRIGRAIRAGGERIRQVAELDDRTRRGSPKDGRSHHEIDRRLRGSEQLLQHAREGSGRAHSLIHAEAEQKRKEGHRWDRVESRIESLIRGRVRSRSHDFDR